MYHVTRWIIAEYLQNEQGNMTINDILKLCPASSNEEILEVIKEYLSERKPMN